MATKLKYNKTDSAQYEYNIRNWTTRIKDGGFEEKIYYNTSPSSNMSIDVNYNGNISAMEWTYNDEINQYVFNYDGLNRLLEGVMKEETPMAGISTVNGEIFSYDKQGNITSLNRIGNANYIDELSMTYDGNQLTKVSDDAGMQNLYATKEYNDRQTAADDFSYDRNGNMIKDLDREIVSIKYNFLNLPDTIQFKNGNQIINQYTADGVKLSTNYYTLVTPIIVPIGNVCIWQYQPNVVDHKGSIYVDNLEYATANGENQNRSLQRIFNSEGYRNNMAEYLYYRKDHLGNNREVWRANDNTTVQRTQYYPTGLPWAEGTGASEQPYKYNGKEFVEMHGYDIYDYGARGYYPAIGRFMTVDPLEEAKPWMSSYVYCSNNPINRIDPTGLADVELQEVTVYGDKKYDNHQQFINNLLTLNPVKSSKNLANNINNPYLNPNNFATPSPNKMTNNTQINKKENSATVKTLEDINAVLTAIGISSDGAEVFTRKNGGEEIIYVTLKGSNAAVNTQRVLAALKGIGNATIVLGIAVDIIHTAYDPTYFGKATVNTVVTAVAVITGGIPGIIIGGGYFVLDQMGAFNRPYICPNYQQPLCPKDATRLSFP